MFSRYYICRKFMMIGIYARLSKDDGNGNDISRSIQNQIKQGEEFATNIKEDYKVYQDDGISGKEFEKRQGLQELLTDIKSGFITTLWVTDQDRLERSPMIRFVLVDIFKTYNIKLFQGKRFIDLDDPDEEYFGAMESLNNNRYLNKISKKVKEVQGQNAREGKVNGILAYGYKKGDDSKIVIDDDESEVIKMIYKYSSEKKGVRQIASILNESDVPTHKYKKNISGWDAHTVYRLIKNPIYKGERRYAGKTYKNVPAIITPAEWDNAQNQLQKNKNYTGKKTERKFLLLDLFECGVCSRTYAGRILKEKGNVYYCRSLLKPSGTCGNGGINLYIADDLIYNIAFELSGKKFLQNTIEDTKQRIENEKEQIEKYKKDLDKLSSKNSNLIKAVMDGILENDEILSMKSEIKSQENHIKMLIKSSEIIINENEKMLERQIRPFQTNNIDPYSFTFEEKEEIIRTHIQKVLITDIDKTPSKRLQKLDLVISYKTNEPIIVSVYLRNTIGKDMFLGFEPDDLFFNINKKADKYKSQLQHFGSLLYANEIWEKFDLV